MLEVKGFKLTNGLEVVAKLGSEDEKTINMIDAFFLQTVQTKDGSINVDYAPLTILGKPSGKTHMGFDVPMPRHSILFTFDLNPGIVEQYNQYTSPIDLSMAPSLT